jgi:signal transduction histidine kinase
MAMEVISLSFLADVALAAGSLGILWLVGKKFSGTTILVPLTVLCGSGSAMGVVSAAIHLTAVPGGPWGIAHELVYTGLIASSLLLPAFSHLLTLYPRRIVHPAVQGGVALLYLLGLAHAALSPTSLVVARFEEVNGEPVAVPADTEWLLLAPSYAFLLLGVAWLVYLTVRGRTDTEKTNARTLMVAVVPAALFISVLPELGWPARHGTLPAIETMAFGWGIMFAGGAIYQGWWRPPVPQGLQHIIDAGTDAILVFDENAHLSTANQAARKLADLGTRRVEGLSLIESLPPDIREESGELLTMSVMGVLRGRIDQNTHEVRGVGKPGRSFSVSVLPVGGDDGGEARGALVILRDETDRIALADANARLTHLQDLVIRVLGHDVKTPLAVIQGYAELARGAASGPLDENAAQLVRRHADRILEAVTSSQLILANARAISRLSAGPGAQVAFEELDITRMARQAGEVMQPLAQSKGLTLNVDAAPGVHARAPKGFESVFMNLLSNAVKYTPPGGHVEMTLRREDGRAVVRVSDTGPGIEPENRGKLFAKFERLDADLGRIEGQGLGLSIVASFVDLVGGHVRVEDRPDGKSGALFVVELLADEGNAPPAPTSSSPTGS